MRGTNTLEIEVTNISTHGFWLFVKGDEFFLPFNYFPWFKKATIEEMSKVELLHNTHLFWPLLDIDLEMDSIMHPENYPLQDNL